MTRTPKFRLQFLKQITAAVFIVGALAWYPLARFAAREVINAAIVGAILSVLNALMGYAAIEYSFNKSYTHFIQIVLGGVVIRLFVMSALLLLSIVVFKVHAASLVVSLFIMYAIFLALEVIYIYNKWQTKVQNS